MTTGDYMLKSYFTPQVFGNQEMVNDTSDSEAIFYRTDIINAGQNNDGPMICPFNDTPTIIFPILNVTELTKYDIRLIFNVHFVVMDEHKTILSIIDCFRWFIIIEADYSLNGGLRHQIDFGFVDNLEYPLIDTSICQSPNCNQSHFRILLKGGNFDHIFYYPNVFPNEFPTQETFENQVRNMIFHKPHEIHRNKPDWDKGNLPICGKCI